MTQITMRVPEWLRAKRDRVPDCEVQYADSPYSAPGYRIVGPDFYTAVPPVDCPADPAVTRAIRAFWPEAIPIWRKQRFLPPGERAKEIVATHHGIATYQPYPKSRRRLFHVEMPAGAKFPQPNQLECIFEHPNFAELGGPGFFLPWDNNLYLCVRGNFRDDMTSSASVFQKVAKRQKEEYDLAQKQRADEFAYRRKHLEARIAATLETLTERDFREYVAKQKAGRPKTPRVFLGGI